MSQWHRRIRVRRAIVTQQNLLSSHSHDEAEVTAVRDETPTQSISLRVSGIMVCTEGSNTLQIYS